MSKPFEIPEEIEACLNDFINDCPSLMSLLYDIDWMPEQLERGSRDWVKMHLLTEAWKNEFGDKENVP